MQAAVGGAVPADDLVLPDRRDFPHLGRDACALLLDGHLRRLARQEAFCRRVLGRLAHALLARRAYHALGFARLSDYARERLGLSAREVQDLSCVAERLERLPAIAAAFQRGELSWTQTRLLAGKATPDTEVEWIALAAGRSTRALEALIAEDGPPAAGDDREDTIDGEPSARFRLRCPPRVRRRWRDVVELARRVQGADGPPWRAAEAVAAEGFSALVDASWLPSRPAAPAPLDPEEGIPGFPDLDWQAVAEAIPSDVTALGEGVDRLDPFALDLRLRAVLRAMQRIDWQMGRWLRLLADLRLVGSLGFPSLARYVRERLGISPAKARALVALDRRSTQAPALAEAYREGLLSWVRALTLLPVATGGTADAWVARGQEVTVRRLEAEVDWALAARADDAPIAPPPAGAPLVIPECQMRARDGWEPAGDEVAFAAPVSVVVLLRSVILACTLPGETAWRGFERLLDHVEREWRSLPGHPDPVFERDGWRCTAPACSSRRDLQDHHILFRSRGGSDALENRTTLCPFHHLRGIHAGRVRAQGRAPDAITWELGVRPGRPPLVQTVGDRYVAAAA